MPSTEAIATPLFCMYRRPLLFGLIHLPHFLSSVNLLKTESKFVRRFTDNTAGSEFAYDILM